MQRHFLLALAVLIAAWLVGLPLGTWTIDPSGNYWSIRGTLILGTGFLAIACMSLAMFLAARPVRLERLLGGLDQFYRLHKRLGIAGVLFGLVHWLLEIVPKWMVGQGWLDRPQRRGAGGAGQRLFPGWEDLAAEARVRLHLILTPHDPLLTPQRLVQVVPEIGQAEVWFCGPKRFGDALRNGLAKLGVPAKRFHQEAFEIR